MQKKNAQKWTLAKMYVKGGRNGSLVRTYLKAFSHSLPRAVMS